LWRPVLISGLWRFRLHFSDFIWTACQGTHLRHPASQHPKRVLSGIPALHLQRPAHSAIGD
jgi:hypothetical protein